MAALSPASAAAIARLRSYVPPPTSWYSLPLSRRAAVLIVLFADRKGDLRVVLTMRAATLRNCTRPVAIRLRDLGEAILCLHADKKESDAGQAALPGGKADSLAETPAEIARREANEEIGLPQPASNSIFPSGASKSGATMADETKYTPETPTLPYPFRLEHLCQLPAQLAKTEVGVRPCVVWLHATSATDYGGRNVAVENTLMPRLDAKEVAAVFSAPFHNFLRSADEPNADTGASAPDVPGKWYEGSWIDWHEYKWRMHNFYVPVKGQSVTWPSTKRKRSAESKGESDNEQKYTNPDISVDIQKFHSSSAPTSAVTVQPTEQPNYPAPSSTLPYRDIPTPSENPLASLSRFRVFGMTARILVDCARIAYGEEPEFPHNSHFGDETMIGRLLGVGRLEQEREKGDEFVGDDIRGALGLNKKMEVADHQGKL